MFDNTETEIRAIELQRLRQLEKQVAHFGPHTEASILVEIQNLYNKYPEARPYTTRNSRNYDLDFLTNVVAAGLQRLTELEEQHRQDAARRAARQLVQDLWMLIITALVFLTMLLVLSA